MVRVQHVVDMDEDDNSSKDEDRVILLWEAREEALLKAWRLKLFNLSQRHGFEALTCKKFYAILGLPLHRPSNDLNAVRG